MALFVRHSGCRLRRRAASACAARLSRFAGALFPIIASARRLGECGRATCSSQPRSRSAAMVRKAGRICAHSSDLASFSLALLLITRCTRRSWNRLRAAFERIPGHYLQHGNIELNLIFISFSRSVRSFLLLMHQRIRAHSHDAIEHQFFFSLRADRHLISFNDVHSAQRK